MSQTQRQEYHKYVQHVANKYNELAESAIEKSKHSNILAAHEHVKLSSLSSECLDRYGKYLRWDDCLFLQADTVMQALQCFNLLSVELCRFGDLGISMLGLKSYEDNLRRTQQRFLAMRSDDGSGENAGGLGDFGENDSTMAEDPRKVTGGLYEFIAHEDLDNSLGDLPGYEEQHMDIVRSYYILDNDAETRALTNDAAERKPRTRAGANVILYGPPGTGKTSAARAAAKYLGLHFVFVNTDAVSSSYHSETEKNLSKLYTKMRALVRQSDRNVLLLIDEVDGLVKNRSQSVSSVDYNLLTRFLTILEPTDGKDNYGVFSVFTTNRISNIDDAFRRRCKAVFLGYLGSPEARMRIFDKVLGNIVAYDAKSGSVRRQVADTTQFWVPGDFINFRTDVVALQLNEFFAAQGTTLQAFIDAFRHTQTDSKNRTIQLPRIAPLDFTRVMQLMRDRVPITPERKYHEYTADS